MQTAMDQAYRFLAQRFLSSYELTQKMRRKQIEDPIIERVLERLRASINILDERTKVWRLYDQTEDETSGPCSTSRNFCLR